MMLLDLNGLMSDAKYLMFEIVGANPETKIALGLAVLSVIILLAFLLPVKKEKI